MRNGYGTSPTIATCMFESLSMRKTILLIHGRGFHPGEPITRQLWLAALRHAVRRDYPRKLDALDDASKQLIYFGDISNAFLSRIGHRVVPDEFDHLQQTLADLRRYRQSDFTPKTYRRLPGRNPWFRELADTFAGPLYHLGLSQQVISSLAPDMAQYWNRDSAFGSDVRFPVIDPLKSALLRGDRLLVIAHSLGSLIAYDTFWKFTHLGEYRPRCCHRTVDCWITLGSPLADPTVRANLKGAGVNGPRRYPHNVRQWVNIAARDDYISYRPRVRRDFGEMLSLKVCRSIIDIQVENLAVSRGRSDPHHFLGYLIHPATARAIAQWL